MVQTLKRLPVWTVYGLLAYMPFHIFLSQWLSTFTGGLPAWKVGKDVVLMAVLLGCLGLTVYRGLHRSKLFLTICAATATYLLLHIGLYFWRGETDFGVGALATVYNNRLLWYLLMGFMAARLWPAALDVRRLSKVVIIVSTAVCLLGLLQWYLPKDVLTHFGYQLDRGMRPAYFIDDKPDLPRVMSTVRDPNSLGAFLVIPILLIVQRVFNPDRRRQRLMNLGLLLLHGQVLFLTFSRGAWAATAISLAALGIVRYRSELQRLLKRFWPWLVAGLMTVMLGAFLLRDQYVIQNIIFHSDETTTAELDSNELHADFVRQGVQGIADQPTGHGPGTAGIVSIQNESGGLLTENYFVQIGYEVGLLGLAVFIGVLAWVQKRLLVAERSDLSLALTAAFWGYLLMAMLAHLWTNEVVAVYWWLLSGAVIGLGLKRRGAGRSSAV